MRRIIVVLAVAALLMPQMSSGAVYGQTDVSFRYVVVFTTDTVPGNAADVIRAAGGDLVTALPQVGVAIAESHDVRFQATLRRHPVVLAVGPERSRVLPELSFQAEMFESEGLQAETPLPPTDDTLYPSQWNMRRVHADAAWNDAGVVGSSAIVVAVIDNGVASNHRDLRAPKLVRAACFAANVTCRPYPQIPFTENGSHGTMVAGIIAAAFGNPTTIGGTQFSVVGVGPNLALASYNVYEPSSDGGFVAFDSSVWAAMMDAAERSLPNGTRVRVINLSLGCYVRSESSGAPAAKRCVTDDTDSIHPSVDAATWTAWNRVVDAVVRRGVVVVASAGNDAVDVNGKVAHIPSDLPQVISVGATGIRPQGAFPRTGAFDILAPYSNVGAAVDLVAPGGDCVPVSQDDPKCQAAFGILSTAVQFLPPSNCNTTGMCSTGFMRGIGTSLAAPHVAGAAGLVLSVNPDLQPQQVAAILKRTASPILRGPDEQEPVRERQKFGHGMVDAREAVNAAHAP